jgi:glycosyltransferase involved in cell wall biosynthesis
METQDGVHALPEVMRLLRDEHGLPGARLTVLGDGGARAAVEQAADSLDVADRIDFLGRVPHDDVARHLAAADICLEPAPCNEMNHRCSMVKVYEYLAAGRAIVSTDLDEVRALGADAIAYAAGDAPADLAAVAARLARDGGERVRRADASAVQARRFTWEGTSAPELVGVYERLAAPG